MAKPDPLAYPCPKCGAQAGQKCKNYAGKGMAPHRDRLRGPAMLASFETKARKETEKEKAQAGLFAPIVRETTAVDEWRRWRRNVAEAAERIAYICGPARRALDWLTINAWKRRALAVVPHGQAAELLAVEWGIEERRGGNEHYASLWGNALRSAGIDPGNWCTPAEPEPHDDGGTADKFRAFFGG